MTPPVLGRYRLDEQVGQGGMAVVWRAWDTQLLRTVAVKVLHPHLRDRVEVRRRFDREAHAVAKLHHPHILDVYDFSGPDADPSWLVTEFIPGQSLRAFAELHPFDPPELAAAALLSIAEALEHAHAEGVVHRDLKPENVMVREDGLLKLTDFGLAALLETDGKLTATGTILGSPGHLAPETIEGHTASPQSDLFSFGTVLYWLACGALPFQAATPAALLQRILECRPPDPRLVRRSVSDGLARVIGRCLERDPAKRFQSARGLKEELRAVLAEAGLDDPEAEVRAFVRAPIEAAASLRARLVARSLERGEAALQARRTPAALAAFGRALALDPGNAVAKARVERIRRRARRLKLLRRGLAALAVLLALGLGARQLALRVERERAEAARQAQARAEEERRRQEEKARLERERIQRERIERERLAREEAERKAALASPAPAAAGPEKRPPVARPVRVRPEGAARPAALQVTFNAQGYWARLTVDGEYLGDAMVFQRALAPGPHKLIVGHDCCEDNTYSIDVRPGAERIQLQFGAPRPARLEVRNAPRDERVFVDGVFISSVADLPKHPLGTDQKLAHKVLLAVGDRSKVVEIKAGFTLRYDYFRDLDATR